MLWSASTLMFLECRWFLFDCLSMYLLFEWLKSNFFLTLLHVFTDLFSSWFSLQNGHHSLSSLHHRQSYWYFLYFLFILGAPPPYYFWGKTLTCLIRHLLMISLCFTCQLLPFLQDRLWSDVWILPPIQFFSLDQLSAFSWSHLQ